MTMNHEYTAQAPTRAELEALDVPAVVEFGTGWCGYCRAAQPLIAQAMAGHPQVLHYKIEDGRGRRLGRSYGIKLWPTLVFLRAGCEVARLVRPVRPDDAQALRTALALIDPEA